MSFSVSPLLREKASLSFFLCLSLRGDPFSLVLILSSFLGSFSFALRASVFLSVSLRESLSCFSFLPEKAFFSFSVLFSF